MGKVRDFFNRIRSVKNKTLTLDEFQQEVAKQQENGVPLNLSGVYACVEIISNTISKLPFFVMDKNTKKHIDNGDGDNLYWLLNYKPNDYMTASVFKKLMISSILLSGNSYLLPIYNKKNKLQVEQLIAVPPTVSVSTSKNKEKVLYKFNYEQKDYDLRYDELVHLKAYTINGIDGVSPLSYAKNTVAVGLNQEGFQRDFYKNGGRPSGTLQTDSDLSSKKIQVKQSDGTVKEVSMKKILREDWDSSYSGNGNAFRTAILDNGLKYETIPQISPADMDFVNSKTVNLEDIARFFNVPPYKLGVGKQTYSNNEQAQIDYITNCIVPLVTQIEQEFTLKLLTKKQQREKGWVIKANVEAELRGDTATRANWYDKMRSMGVYSINEIRAYENLPKIENGDARLIGANSVPLERLLSGESAAQATPNPLSEEEVNDLIRVLISAKGQNRTKTDTDNQ